MNKIKITVTVQPPLGAELLRIIKVTTRGIHLAKQAFRLCLRARLHHPGSRRSHGALAEISLESIG